MWSGTETILPLCGCHDHAEPHQDIRYATIHNKTVIHTGSGKMLAMETAKHKR
jgi:hypothetical protein